MTPAEQQQIILGRLLYEKGGLPYIEQLCKEYEGKDRNDRSRLKRALLKCLYMFKEEGAKQ